MASSKPRGRPPADGNFIMWTEPLVESLLKLRFEKYAEPMAAARGTKSLRVAWAELAKELTLQNNGDVVSVEQCRNKTGAPTSKAAPVLDGGKQAIPQDITSASTQTARLNKPPLECTGMAKVEKLINDGFAKVLEGQAKQLKLVEEQNQLLAQIFETLQRSKHQDNTSDLE
ncbi:hypothetical protein AM587_10005725 [Phytophthora nicotianae]|uniref:Uncharacterized protein n=1 Tax=Phytophthora nicotianae TaxID=4792 RepID=A0A0W8E042_PHYNI|nr:hypothetical protein AM587_10005116 [Phytophthora nicotianae]KUG01667.1 hypothetical protein AM587_10005725 [Phytophthora nicotianae]